LLRDRKGEAVSSSGDQNDFNAQRMGPSQRAEIALSYLELGVKKSAVNIDGEKSYGGRAHFVDFSIGPVQLIAPRAAVGGPSFQTST
jgi:hypothetical protein